MAPNTHFTIDGGAPGPLVVKAKHDFDTKEADELAFKAGQDITILEKDVEPGWHKGKIGARTGLVPTTHVSL